MARPPHRVVTPDSSYKQWGLDVPSLKRLNNLAAFFTFYGLVSALVNNTYRPKDRLALGVAAVGFVAYFVTSRLLLTWLENGKRGAQRSIPARHS